MTTFPSTFSPQLLNDLGKLKTLFTGDEEMAALDELPQSNYIRPKGELYMSRWEIGWILGSTPFRLMLYIFLKAIASFLECLGILGVSRRIQIEAHHLAYPFDVACNQLFYGRRFLAPSLNDYRKDLADLYTLKNIDRNRLLHPMLKEKLHPLAKEVRFDLFGKLCHGSVHWFNYLFLKGIKNSKTAQECTSFIDYARALMELLKEGQPRQAALLQSIYGLEEEMLSIKQTSISVPLESLKLEQSLRNLPKGVYHLGLPKHSVSYIKFGKEEMVMDPDRGLILVENLDHLLNIIHDYTKGHKDTKIYFFWQALEKEGASNRLSA